ncbi:MAG: hypothetical protein JXB43_09885 [Dehalococcoidia bacterium]|nr:hypothetical protein [Dehalococcoidia bacterium]
MRQRFACCTLLLLCIILTISMVACACNPTPVIEWYRTFGSGGGGGDGRSVQQTLDGGYIICGKGGSLGAFDDDTWLIKTDAEGNKLWDKTFGGKRRDDSGNAVQQTTDGGYIICGNTSSWGADDQDIWVIKTDADGNKLWDKTFGGSGSNDGNAVQQTTDGGYIVCGTTESNGDSAKDTLMIKIDADGNKLWDKTFGSEKDDEGNSVQQTADGGYIICGTTSSYEGVIGSFVLLIKTDSDGNRLWDKTFDVNGLNGGSAVKQTKDGGYIICGYKGSLYGYKGLPEGYTDARLIKTDNNGTKLWDKIFDFRQSDHGSSVQQTKDGGYIMCGCTISTWQMEFSISKLFLVKTDADGNKLWDKTFGSALANTDGSSVQQTMDGGYIVCGRTNSSGSNNVLLLKLAPEH